MPMGMGMGPMMPAAMQMAAMASGGAGGAKSSSAPPGAGNLAQLQLADEPAASPEDIASTIEGLEEGEMVTVAYTHPQLGKTKYQGTLSEKYVGASNLQSYIQLSDCKRIGSRGHVREREASKRLMTAFIDGVSVLEQGAARSPSRSRSRRKDRSRSRGRRSPAKS
mmetsp:Transcript_20704/g.65289  ORF Transcript_20704/g.65289 Transcript_20704/m.65289 type:complete len:166 (-) Transcript_20704:161-658(-)